MARGHWRNWDETACEGCGNPIYQKYGKKHKGKLYCQLCYKEIKKKEGRGWHESPDISGKAPDHRDAKLRAQAKEANNSPIKQSDKTNKFGRDFMIFLNKLKKKNQNNTTIPEFQLWLRESLMPFEQKSPREQIDEKIYYEKSIGNDTEVFHSITNFLNNWLSENIEEPKDNHIWYHGTTEDRYRKILADGEIKVSTAETSQHKDFAHDIGTISLARHKGMAHFFSGLSGMGRQNQIILHIDTCMLDSSAISRRDLFAHKAEILYHKNIPASAIIKAETVYVARKQEVV